MAEQRWRDGAQGQLSTGAKPSDGLEAVSSRSRLSTTGKPVGAPQQSYGGQPSQTRPAVLPFQRQHSALAASPLTPAQGSPQTQLQPPQPPRLSSPALQPVSEPSSSKRIPCSFYLKTGSCAFGTECKFEHPLDQPLTQYNSLGLPLRPGEPDCAYYVRNLHCGYGPSCKFNHNEPVYSFMPIPYMDPTGMGPSPMGIPVQYGALGSTQPAGLMPAHPVDLQLQALMPGSPLAAAPPQQVGMGPQLGQFIPRMAAHGSPALPYSPPPHMLQQMGHPAMLHQMAATGIPPSMYPGYPQAYMAPPLFPALSAGQASRPSNAQQMLQPAGSDARPGDASQTSDSSGATRGYEGKGKRRQRSSRSGEAGSLPRDLHRANSRQFQREASSSSSSQKGRQVEKATEEKSEGGLPISASGSTDSVSGDLSKLSIASRDDRQ